eukprot:jgi/Mesen1/6615/ME000034S06074
MDGTMWLHNPRSAQIKKVIESQKVGQVTRVNALFYFMGDEDFLANNIRVKPGLDGLGCLGDLGWYCIGAALWAFDYDLPHIIAAHPGPTRNIDGVVISCGASMSWKDGRSAVLNFGFDNHFREVLILGGTKGVVTLEDFVIPLQEDKCSFRIDSKGGLAENATKCTTEFSRHEVQLTLPQEALMLQQFASIVQGVKSGTQAPDAYWPSVSRKTQQARCPLPHFAMAPMPPPPAPPVRPRSTAEAIAAFLVLNLQTAPLGCLYATCWRVHGLLYACKLSSGGEATSAVIAGWLAEIADLFMFREEIAWAAMTHMVSNPHMSHPTTKMLTLVIATCLASAPHSVVPPLARAAASSLPLLPAPHQQPLPLPPARCQAEDDPVGGLVLWAETLLTFVGGQSAHRCSSEDELKTAALVQYLAKSSHGQSQQKLAHRALSAAMDALLELRDLRASADMEDAEGSDNEDEEDEDEEDEEDGKEGEESEEEGEDRGGRGRAHGLGEETDEEFDRRYAEIARRMQEEREEAEDDGGDVDSEERSVPKELGELVSMVVVHGCGPENPRMVDQRNETEALLACLKAHGPALFSQHPPPQELIVRFTEAYGEAASTFPAL